MATRKLRDDGQARLADVAAALIAAAPPVTAERHADLSRLLGRTGPTVRGRTRPRATTRR